MSIKANNIEMIQRLKYITSILKKPYIDNIYKSEKEVDTSLRLLKKEQNEIFQKMILNGDLDKYMAITRDFTSHTYS